MTAILTCPCCGERFENGWTAPSEFEGIKFQGRVIKHCGGEHKLAPQEMRIMEALMKAFQKPVSRGALQSYMYAFNPDRELCSPENLKTRTHFLRKKLEGSGLKVQAHYGGWLALVKA